MPMKKVIYTFAIYEDNPSFLSFTLPTIIAYAKSLGADFKLISNTGQINMRYPRSKMIAEKGEKIPHFYKLYALEEFLYSQYDKMMLIDDDILVRNASLDLFKLHKDGHFLASQHIDERGINYLAMIEKENTDKLQIKEIIKNSNNSNGDFLSKQLRNIINSGLYVIDKNAVNTLMTKFKGIIEDYSQFAWYDQGYLMEKLAEARIPFQEIPGRVHANPCREILDIERNSIKDRNTDFYHFNGLKVQEKNVLVEKFFYELNNFFCTPVVVTGQIAEKTKEDS
ncbi:MAG: hypothetical protein ACR2ON_00555 [Paracoccaceae bacterium]